MKLTPPQKTVIKHANHYGRVRASRRTMSVLERLGLVNDVRAEMYGDGVFATLTDAGDAMQAELVEAAKTP